MAIIAIVVAIPLSYYLAHEWLNRFAYRTPLRAWFFVVGGGCTLLVTWITVGIHTVRAARINPATSLRHE